MKALCFSLCVLCLSACWTMGKLTRDYCQNMNAYEKGRLEALHGQTGKKFDQDIKKCAQYGVALNQEQYQQGREKGLKLFCSYDKGHEWGLKGNKYLNTCPKGLEPAFLKGWRHGDKKCAYNAGEADGANGKTDSFSSVKCLNLNSKLSRSEYKKGRTRGLKSFCVYNKGYERGLAGNPYLNVCPKNLEPAFLKGWRQGDKKCAYNAGEADGANGKTAAAFSDIKCAQAHKKLSQREYTRGRNKGIKLFCSYKKGYDLGINGYRYANVCPKELEPDFLRGYTLGFQEYKKEKRHQERLSMERRRIAVERARVRAQAEALRLEKLRGKALCRFDSDCDSGGDCRYNYVIRGYACHY